MRSNAYLRRSSLVAALVLLTACAVRAEDAPKPVTAQTLPPGTFLYVHIGAWNTWESSFGQTSLAQICNEPEVRTFVAGPLEKLAGLLNRAIGGPAEGAPGKKEEGKEGEPCSVCAVFHKLGQVTPGPTTIAMKYDKEDQAAKRPPAVAIVLGTKNLGEDLQKTISNVLQQMMPQKEFSSDKWMRRVQFILAEVNDMIQEGTGKGIVIEHYKDADLRILPMGRFTVTMTLYKQNLVLASDQAFAKQILDGMAGTLPATLAQDATYAACGLGGSEHLSAYLDVKGLREVLSIEQAAPKIQEMLAKAGLDNLHAAAWSLRMNGAAFESRTAVVSDAKRTGVLGAIDSEPLSVEALKIARADAPEVLALRVKGDELYPILRGMLQGTVGAESAGRLDNVEKKMAAEGQDLKKLLAEAFTGELVVTRYSAQATPIGAFSSEVGSATVRDAAKAQKLMVDVMKRIVAEREGAEKFEDVYKEADFEGAKICYLQLPPGQKGMPPVFAHVDNRVLVALDMQTLKAAVKDVKTPGLTETESFKAGLQPSGGKLGSAIYFNDWRQRYINIFDVGAKTLKLAASLDLLRGPGIDVNLLPAPESVAKHLFPSLTNIQATDTALVLTSRSPLPSPEVVGPPFAAFATVIATFIPERKPAPDALKEEVKKTE
ncbi:MAG: hypothetical protein HY291_18220 [Planctomycetes bacterium]|nr:hypothetical protein [Planctomycetota bacterium]